jgi:hypothetical protein
VEYWIPAADLSAFNASLPGLISIDAAYFGKEFKGYIPEEFGLRGKDVASQFVILATAWDYSRMDFVAEVSASRKAVFLNFLYWAQHDFQALGLGKEQGCDHRAAQRSLGFQSRGRAPAPCRQPSMARSGRL